VHRAKAYFIKGFVFSQTHDTSRAISSFQTCVEQEPEYYDAFIQLGILFEAKRSPLAVEYYNRALKLRPTSTEALYDRGKFFQDNGELDKAIDDYNSIIKIDPGYKDAYFNLGYIEVNSHKNYQKAIEYFSKAIDRDKYYAAAFYNRGYCYEMTDDKQNAKKDYLSALGIDQTFILPKNGLKRIGG
jgi:tetratricopeptide (TPR) repeat protein